MLGNVGEDQGDATLLSNEDTSDAVNFEAINTCTRLIISERTAVFFHCCHQPQCVRQFSYCFAVPNLVVTSTPSRLESLIGDFLSLAKSCVEFFKVASIDLVGESCTLTKSCDALFIGASLTCVAKKDLC